jgi:hypothetical protein
MYPVRFRSASTCSKCCPPSSLDHEPPFKATEVCDVSPDSILASEFCAKLPAAQSHPELQLGPGLIAPQLPRAVE